ncbi:NAD(P)-binding protein [Hypoxylon sp. FL0543]|nr:NAD(P)-binding protein [Hypoxylon sp. FL0543]
MATKLTLNGGIALITGAASGIGKETAFAFAEAGAEGIVFADLNEKGAQEAAEESKKYATNEKFRALAIQVDIVEEDSVQSMVDATIREFGRIDYNVNSAGISNLSSAIAPHLKTDIFSKTVDVNIKGMVFCVRAVTKAMAQQEPLTYTSRRHGTRSLGRGSIVNLGSANSYVVTPGMLSYATTKHAVMGITKSAAIDCFQSLIRVNAVCPAWVDTPMVQAGLQRVPKLGQFIQASSPLRRMATAEEVADYIVFLCSPSSTYINGTGLLVDAGLTVTAHTG